MDEAGRFLAGVAAVIRRADDGRVLLLRRSEEKSFGAGVWECVTGRVQQEEGFEAALSREVREETRLEVSVEYIVGTTHFYRGEPLPENELLGVVFACLTDTPQALLTGEEHSESRWVTLAEARSLLVEEDASTRWMRGIVERMEVLEAHTAPEVRAHYREAGVETG